MRFRTTRQADQDIIDIYVNSAAAFGADQAERYHAGLVSVFGLLAENPGLARARPEFDPPVRLHRYQAHMIVYIEDDDGILIIRVLHARRDWQSILES